MVNLVKCHVMTPSEFLPSEFPDNVIHMHVAELQKTIRGLIAEDRLTLAAIATRMKQRHARYVVGN